MSTAPRIGTRDDLSSPPLRGSGEIDLQAARAGRREILGRADRPAHLVQFYDAEPFLAETLTEFVAAGLAAGEPAVVIATPEHREALLRGLGAKSFDVERARALGHLVMLDAAETLATFMVGSRLDAERFRATIAPVFESCKALRPDRPVRAYGEMVDLLWKRGDAEAAVALELLWNDLAGSHEFVLLCAYDMNGFHHSHDGAHFERICRAHAHVWPTESYATLHDEDGRMREMALLQQRARALESEIEERRQLEQMLVDALARLRQREGELQDFLDNAVEGIHWVGPDGLILWANQAELDLLGYPADEYIGHDIADFHVDAGRITDLLQRLARGETVRDYEARLRCKDGSTRHVVIHSNVLWRDGKFVHTRCFTRDVTGQKRFENELRLKTRELESTVSQLEAANRTKDEFLATVSHELRTPLNAILGWVRMLQGGVLPSDKEGHALETIERNANVQAQLIEDLLDVSRILSGKIRLDVGIVDVSAVVDAAIEAVRPAAYAKNVSLHREIEAGLPTVLGDPHRLQQVVWNLLTNAVKFTPSGGTIRVHARLAGGGGSGSDAGVEIVVADDGLGIDADFLPHVFERFRQADGSAARKHGGLGLGLALVRHFVELHGGVVTVASAGAGKGSTFAVRLPASAARAVDLELSPAPTVASSSRVEPPQATGALEGIRVVVAEDDADARELLTEVLTSSGAVVHAAPGVDAALELVRTTRPDIVVSDIAMPEADGYDLIRRLRALPAGEGGDTPAVALTAYARFEDRTKALTAGFNLHVPKPVEPSELISVLASLAAVFPPGATSRPS